MPSLVDAARGMFARDGWYYLHTNGDMIWKKFEPERESTFVVHVWPVDLSNRENGWTIVLEGIALGANAIRIKELMKEWSCTLDDSFIMAYRMDPNPLTAKGLKMLCAEVWGMAFQDWRTKFVAHRIHKDGRKP